MAFGTTIALFVWAGALTSSCGRGMFADLCRLQGLPQQLWALAFIVVSIIWAIGLAAFQAGQASTATEPQAETDKTGEQPGLRPPGEPPRAQAGIQAPKP